MKTIFGSAIVATLAFAAPAFAMSDADCKAEFTKADVNKDGVLADTEAARYSTAMTTKGKAMPADGKMTEAIFMENCKSDVFASQKADTGAATKTDVKTDAGAPMKGANSFTETQAKDRAMAAGFTDVSALKKDADGIWRGIASQNGKSSNIAIDFKGNVVATGKE